MISAPRLSGRRQRSRLFLSRCSAHTVFLTLTWMCVLKSIQRMRTTVILRIVLDCMCVVEPFSCPACSHNISKFLIEALLMERAKRMQIAYRLQDRRCTKCKQVNFLVSSLIHLDFRLAIDFCERIVSSAVIRMRIPFLWMITVQTLMPLPTLPMSICSRTWLLLLVIFSRRFTCSNYYLPTVCSFLEHLFILEMLVHSWDIDIVCVCLLSCLSRLKT